MRNKIAYKLFLAFSCALLLFTLVVGGVFSELLTRQTVRLHQDELEQRATRMADTLADFLGSTAMRQGFGAYMRFLDEIAMSDVWVVDSNLQFLSWGNSARSLEYSQLPADGMGVVQTALTGRVSTSESFSDLLGVRSTTVGAPIIGHYGKPLGVVLLHSPISDTSKAIRSGLRLLAISAVLALAIALPASYLLSVRFTGPLRRMQAAALRIAGGDYAARTEVRQGDEIGELAGTLDQMADKLRDAAEQSGRLEQMRRDFTANVSHELRTPVTVLRGSLEALCDRVISEPEQVREYQQQMLKETVHLERLVNDLLELSRLQNPNFVVQMAPLSLMDLVADVSRAAKRIAAPRQIALATDIRMPDLTIHGDYSRLRQMLLAVLDNAVKFSPDGGQIDLQLVEKGQTYQIQIRDSGCGIPADQLPYIFDRFHKAHDEQNRSGTGLGLAIAKQIAERHGIHITVESAVGQGTRVIFHLTKPELNPVTGS